MHPRDETMSNDERLVDLSKLYKNIDIPETLLNLLGKWIKKITAHFVEFKDGEKPSFLPPFCV